MNTSSRLSIFLFCLLLSGVKAQTTVEKVDILRCTYFEVTNNQTLENWENYVESFPNSFREFDSIFGCRNNIEGLLYPKYQQYVELFFSAQNYVEHNNFYKKIINIAIDGTWDADAVNLFQDNIVNIILEENKKKSDESSILDVLSLQPDSVITLFWRFYYDDLYPECFGEKYIKTCKKLYCSPRLFVLMDEYYKSICK